MLQQLRKHKTVLFSLFVAMFILACIFLVPDGSNPPEAEATEAGTGPEATDLPPQATPTLDMEGRIKSANVLVYENTIGQEIPLTHVIQNALDEMGMKYTQTGSDSGTFMDHLVSDTIYDLIIVGAEAKNKPITGLFWDEINKRLTRDNAALIAEIWNLDTEANGPISNILSGCGIRYQKDYSVAGSIYWWDSTHPIFTEPNVVPPLLHYGPYWDKQAGDRIRLADGGDATLLAGLAVASSNDEAVLATCYQGRVIIQTFSDHDYGQDNQDQGILVPLWENYIHYTLKNHFAVTP